jgi:hypothetical protein
MSISYDEEYFADSVSCHRLVRKLRSALEGQSHRLGFVFDRSGAFELSIAPPHCDTSCIGVGVVILFLSRCFNRSLFVLLLTFDVCSLLLWFSDGVFGSLPAQSAKGVIYYEQDAGDVLDEDDDPDDDLDI